MKILLVYPEFPDTFWSFKHALKFIQKKAGSPPLGLLTVAAMLPSEWEKRLVDLNVVNLKDEDLKWADYVFLSAMAVQRTSVHAILKRCRASRVKVVAGGPLFTMEPEQFPEVGLHLVQAVRTLGEMALDLHSRKFLDCFLLKHSGLCFCKNHLIDIRCRDDAGPFRVVDQRIMEENSEGIRFFPG